MSDLAVTTNTDSILNELELSLFPGIQEAEPERERKEYLGYTKKTTLENIRVLNSGWRSSDSLSFSWNQPGSTETEEFEDDIPVIKGIKGFIVHSQIQPALKKSDPTNPDRKLPVCSLFGYKAGDKYVQDLPATIQLGTSKKAGGVYGTMYDTWDKVANKPDTIKPHHDLEKYGFLGSRGKSCVDCIKCGESTIVDDLGKENECQLEGRIFIYATHLIKYKKGEPIEITVKDLIGEEGMIIMVNLPNKIAMVGRYSSEPELQRNTYLKFLTQLHFQYWADVKAGKGNYAIVNPSYYHQIVLTVKPGLPDKDTGKPKGMNYLNFEEVTCDREACKKAMQYWNSVHPYEAPPELDSSNWVINGVGGTTVYSSAKVTDYNDDLPMLEATIEPEEESGHIPF